MPHKYVGTKKSRCGGAQAYVLKNLLLSVRHSLTMMDEENESRRCCFLSKKSHSINQQEDLNYTAWICTVYRSHLMTCRDALLSVSMLFFSFWAGILCHLCTVWNLRNMPNPQPLVKGLDGRVSRVLYISLMIVLVHVMSRIHES